jgi:7,8-didemethyl-8-hydroxy-5-deazariboflavin synthase CofG subunit
MAGRPSPSIEEVLSTVAVARSMMPDMNIQVPPNLVASVRHFLSAGANDLGGISILTHDFINPEHPWPSVAELRAEVERAGWVPRERLPIYPRYALDAGFMSKEVKERVIELAGKDGYRAC